MAPWRIKKGVHLFVPRITPRSWSPPIILISAALVHGWCRCRSTGGASTLPSPPPNNFAATAAVPRMIMQTSQNPEGCTVCMP